MLSVIVYGRNDSHGYNLARRAALSLNCLAEVLDAPGDEILFVDYNTSDDLPSFLEANNDTLTARARRLIRGLRVRPRQHARFAARSHLPVLEAIARNVAIRRSNPANRWLLSTNSDIIVTPRTANRTLSALVADLPDGFYHVPRYELPQTIWESFDRNDPATAIARTAALAPRLHLEEIVATAAAHGVDSPGDFQLVLRQDLFALNGFDEEMLLGWHLDANLARRLAFRYGPAQLLHGRLAVYHCDHTRQATLTHGSGHLENDWTRFVEAVVPENSHLPAQAGLWGLADEEIEEIRLDRNAAGTAYLSALDVLPPPPRQPYQYLKLPETFNNLHYPPEHVLPYLTDLLSALPRHSDVGYYGCRPRMAALFAQVWGALGFTGKILSGPEALTRADFFIFEFGLASGDETVGNGAVQQDRDSRAWNDGDLEKLWVVYAAYTAVAADERQRNRQQRRRIILINVIHNIFETRIDADITSVHTPFSSRLRQGFVRDSIMTERPLPPVAGSVALDPCLPLDRLPVPNAADSTAPADDTLSRLASLSHWQDPAWVEALYRGFGRDTLDHAPRNLWLWERGQILYGLARLGVLREDARILVAAALPEPLYAALSGLVGEVVVADWRPGFDDANSDDASSDDAGSDDEDPAWRRPLPLLRPSGLRFRRDTPAGDEAEAGAFDAVIFPHGVALRHGPASLAHALPWASHRLKPGGILAFSANIRIAGQAAPGSAPLWLDGTCFGEQGLETALARHAGLMLLAPGLPVLDTPTLSRNGSDESADGTLVIARDDVVLTGFVGFLRRLDDSAPFAPDWPALLAAMGAPLAGPKLDCLTATADARRHADGAVTIAATAPAGHFLFGPYTPLPAGDYRLSVLARAIEVDDDAPALGVRVYRNDGHVLAERVVSAGFLARSPLVLSFTVASLPRHQSATVEFQCTHLAGVGLQIDSVDLALAGEPSNRLYASDRIDRLLGSIMTRMALAPACRYREDGTLHVPPGSPPGHILYGPYLGLPAGDYRLTFAAIPDDVADDEAVVCTLVVAVADPRGDDLILAELPLSARRLRNGPASLRLAIPPEYAVDGNQPRSLEIRVGHPCSAGLTVLIADLRRDAPDSPPLPVDITRLGPVTGSLLKRLLRTGSGRDIPEGLQVTPADPAGCLLYGPYLYLPAGDYTVSIALRFDVPAPPGREIVRMEAAIGNTTLASCSLDQVALHYDLSSLSFTVPPRLAFDGEGSAPLEIRIYHSGHAHITITDVNLLPINK